ncbi:long-chain-fatty-acid--CoA ligase [Noviherbaspirillum sp. Root189]|uniref:long-chain-fatty-acid--CoA ligase n=1 Tax=Noviherbaspirillum sp. Root189 TaxID=1736487 RepID=UPI00070C5B79|nr:long-chain-fatty-acid--CoA ligase [Noviherbaspirillum sp. Root189]KRB70612.1 long-chain fatty acid--CoA ligase [Noviherbaspirillum sp. Root189]
MYGLMQDWQLLCHRVIEHAARQHGERRVVSRTVEGPIKVTNYAEIHERALRVSKRLVKDSIRPGDRIATLAWSTSNHLECWYGIAGIGAIYHPVNPRLFSEQISYIINNAKDRVLLLDTSFVELVESLSDGLPTIERYVILTDRANMPQTRLRNAIAYEDWIAEVDADFTWHSFDENTAASLAYTSGTTGQPKGVLYSHRSIVLMSLAANSPDMYGFGSNDVVLQVVPMCHANGWTWPFSAPMAGAELVLPGAQLDGESLSELLLNERVTCTGGVPTVWQGVLAHLAERGETLTDLKRIYIGGSPCPRSLMEAFMNGHGVEVRSAFGMTEMGPMAAICSLMPETHDLTGDAMVDLLQTQGRPPFMVEFRTEDDEGRIQPWDGVSAGHLKARGPCIVQAYYGNEIGSALDEHGFFDTGDIAAINKNGYVRLTDRAKDLVKSGGEWISSIDLENHVMDHPDVFEAAVIGAKHPKWDERPVVVAVRKEGSRVSKEDIMGFLTGKIAKWWMPDDIIFVDSLPHTATGKLHKSVLRSQYENHLVGRLTG